MNVAAIVTLILQVVTQLLPLAEQLKALATTTTVTPGELATINAQLQAAHDRLGALLGIAPATPPVK